MFTAGGQPDLHVVMRGGGGKGGGGGVVEYRSYRPCFVCGPSEWNGIH